MQILPNVFLVNGFPYGQHQNSYVVRLGDELVMIDAGDLETETFDLMQTNCAAWGIRLERIRYLLVTHAHFDHFSKEDLAKIESPSTRFVVTKDVAKEIKGNITTVAPGDTVTVGDLKVVAVPAYNIGKRFHPKENGWVGYVIQLPDGMRVYHAGDTDFIPEMKQVQTDVALLPIGGTYTMDYQQAAEAARAIRPKVVIPMHWGDIVGTREDAEKFREAYQGEVLILTPER